MRDLKIVNFRFLVKINQIMNKRLLVSVSVILWIFSGNAYSMEKKLGKYHIFFEDDPDGNLVYIAVFKGKIKILGYRSPEGGGVIAYVDPAVGEPVTINYTGDNKFINFAIAGKEKVEIISWKKDKLTVEIDVIEIPSPF